MFLVWAHTQVQSYHQARIIPKSWARVKDNLGSQISITILSLNEIEVAFVRFCSESVTETQVQMQIQMNSS